MRICPSPSCFLPILVDSGSHREDDLKGRDIVLRIIRLRSLPHSSLDEEVDHLKASRGPVDLSSAAKRPCAGMMVLVQNSGMARPSAPDQKFYPRASELRGISA